MTSSAIETLQQLGVQLEEVWRRHDHDVRVFPRLAAERLGAAQVNLGSPDEVLLWAIAESKTSAVSDLTFGSPPITVYRSDRFYIEVLHWINGSIDPHEHQFEGAFRVLWGSSLHLRYAWREAHRVNPFLSTGQLSQTSWELLGVGDTRPIYRGYPGLHTLMHLDYPSVSVVVRTGFKDGDDSQASYASPNLRFTNELNKHRPLKKQRQLMWAVAAISPDYPAVLGQQICEHDAEVSLWMVFDHAMGRHRHRADVAALIAAYRRAHGDLADYLEPLLAERNRQLVLRQLRRRHRHLEARFLLAALMLLDNQADIFAACQARFDAEPTPIILGALTALGQRQDDGGYVLLDLHLRPTQVKGALTCEVLVEATLAVLLEHADPQAARRALQARLGSDAMAHNAQTITRLLDARLSPQLHRLLP